MDFIQEQLKNEFNLKDFQVKNTVELIDGGNTIPFIARYRKEMTGELSDEILREFHERLLYLRKREERKEEIIRLIDEQGKLYYEGTNRAFEPTERNEMKVFRWNIWVAKIFHII